MASTDERGIFPRLDVRKHSALLAAALMDLDFAGDMTIARGTVSFSGRLPDDLSHLASLVEALSKPRPLWFLVVSLRRTLPRAVGTELIRRADADQSFSPILSRRRYAVRPERRRAVRAEVSALLGGRACRPEDIILARIARHYSILDPRRFRPSPSEGESGGGRADLVLDQIIAGIRRANLLVAAAG